MSQGVEREVDVPLLAPPFEEFFAAQYRSLLALATVLTGSWAIGEDVVQEALFAASRSWPKISVYDDPGQWTRGVVMRRASNVRRGRFREARAASAIGGTPRDGRGPARDRRRPILAVGSALTETPT